jgi:hypothetical protein
MALISRVRSKLLALAALVVLCAGALPASSTASTIAGDRGYELPQVPSGIGVGLTMNYDVAEPASELGRIDYVWGASSPAPASIYNTAYIKYARDQMEVHPLSWWQANHPTWIEYTCGRRKPAYQFHHKNIPLDITNPEVLAYQWQEEIEPRLAEGYAGIAFDNLELINESKRCGHFDSEGRWVQQFTGKRREEPAFTKAVLEWAATTRAEVHAYSPTATVSINYSYDPRAGAAANTALMEDADLLFDERGMTNWGQAGNDRPSPELWLQIYESALALQQGGSCYDLNEELPGPSSAIPAEELQWAVANYLLIKGPCTYVSISGFRGKKGSEQDYGVLHWYPQYETPIGEPSGAAVEQPSGAYLRRFTGGLARVNPTSAIAEVALPAGEWYEAGGEAVSGSVALAAHQGMVLTSSP